MTGGPQDRRPGATGRSGRGGGDEPNAGEPEWLVLDGGDASRPPAQRLHRRPSRRTPTALLGLVALTCAAIGVAAVAERAGRPAAAPLAPVVTDSLPATTTPPPLVPPGVHGGRPGRDCAASDLAWTTTGWDQTMGKSATTVQVTNVSESWCRLAGYPDVRIDQGGRAMGLTVTRTTVAGLGLDDAPAPAAPATVRLEPRTSAAATLWWRGYRTAADQRTPQRLLVQLPRDVEVDVPLTAGPAPFDVIPGAHVQLAPWTAARRPDGTPP